MLWDSVQRNLFPQESCLALKCKQQHTYDTNGEPFIFRTDAREK